MKRTIAVGLAFALPACSIFTQYTPRTYAPREITVTYRDNFVLSADDHAIAKGPTYRGLEPFVSAVPLAADNAKAAHHSGVASVVLATLGGSFGVAALGGVVGAAADRNTNRAFIWLGAGAAVAVAGLVMAGLGRAHRNRANGHAIEALNFYNDALHDAIASKSATH